MPRYKVILDCSGPHGDAVLTYRVAASRACAAEFKACQMAGDHYPEYTDIRATRTEVIP